ncbi:hypothetical protein SNEBB_000839 [Seison nebaliae]|nr:hypothetical protein SNEBB_000839 [Seison nebaliae]
MSSHDNDVPFLPIYSLSFATYSIDSSYITSDSSQHSSMSSGLNDEIGENDETNSEEKLEPASDNERKLVKIFASIDLEEMNSETDQRQFSETFQPFSNVGVDGGGEANHDNNKENDDMRVAETMRRTKSLKITQPLRSKENKQKKMVRFADSFGLDLELVHIIQVEDPFGNDTKLLNKRLENKLKFKESSIFTSLSNQPIISVNLPPYESKELKESNENGKSEKRKRQNYSSKSSSSDTKENAELRFAIYTKPVCHLVPKHVWKTSNSISIRIISVLVVRLKFSICIITRR